MQLHNEKDYVSAFNEKTGRYVRIGKDENGKAVDSDPFMGVFPELLDVTEELLLASVDELDFAEEELFFDEDETPLPPDLPPLLLLESSSLLEAELLVEISPADSGATPEEDSSSPQAIKDIVMANSAAKINIVPL